MVSAPSGLLTCLQRFSAWRTWLRLVSAWALGLGLVFIALRTAVASDHTILVFGDSLSAAYGIRPEQGWVALDRKSTRLNSSHLVISYAVFCLKKKKKKNTIE